MPRVDFRFGPIPHCEKSCIVNVHHAPYTPNTGQASRGTVEHMYSVNGHYKVVRSAPGVPGVRRLKTFMKPSSRGYRSL